MKVNTEIGTLTLEEYLEWEKMSELKLELFYVKLLQMTGQVTRRVARNGRI